NAIGNCPTTGDAESARPRKTVRSGVGGTPTVSGLYGGSTPCAGNCATLTGPTGSDWPGGMERFPPRGCALPISVNSTLPRAPAARAAPTTSRLKVAILSPHVVGHGQPIPSDTG